MKHKGVSSSTVSVYNRVHVRIEDFFRILEICKHKKSSIDLMSATQISAHVSIIYLIFNI